ncbi:PREDICTED: two pore calcium channel protein 1-like isoform X2 [Nicrophorus vespilloides]|uniref:Two pore calcium channel protein 1-like isoform X2 n=1 Tax=Nicrophorus vespilloides TaxID=110193 RepID=A0ABM1MCY0_NICVS|nr:PREDICTED: two pore calcium channel protein 1-like isoform X2 [Nicrophorus vespilloides]
MNGTVVRSEIKECGALLNAKKCEDVLENIVLDSLDEMGSRSSLSREVDVGNDHWGMNYHEAAIFLEEGENNEKFDSHPRHPAALPAYLLVHNNWYYGLDLIASLVLLALAVAEEPAVADFTLPVGIHGTLELMALGIITIELFLKLQWTGFSTIWKHKRTSIKAGALLIMACEALIVLIRQESHFRVTRALRPIFLVDTKVCGNVRRFIRQIFQSLPPILDMLGLLMFFVSSYALLGYYLFSDHHHNLYFKTLPDSFVSMFVLLTTANFPDVMMPSYASSKWNAIFFISYIGTVLYVLMNLMLAVVYETFTGIEKDKFRKLLLHKRKACKLAFPLLVSKQNPDGIKFKQFSGMMQYYAPRISNRDVVLIFRQLNASGSGSLTSEEFFGIYDAASLRWHLKDPPDPWFNAAWPPLRFVCRAARALVLWKYFEHIVYVLIIGNGVAMFIRIAQSAQSLEESATMFSNSWDTYLFLSIFLFEALIRVIAIGWTQYIGSGWNIFDLGVTLAALLGSLVLLFNPTFTVVVILRPLRLLRLFKLKKRYRDIFGTLVLLSPLMWSTAVVMLVMYYFFAIIGMELFASSSEALKNCCVNTTVEDFFKYSANGTTAIGYYYMNNFGNLLSSGVTLFELTVVNNWFIIMDAFAHVTNQYSRIFFMLFYLYTMVVLTIVVASVLEAFRFRIQYKRQTSKRDEEQMLLEEVRVEWNSLISQVQDSKYIDGLRTNFVPGGVTIYVGKRRRNREVLQRRMYMAEIEKWLVEDEVLDRGIDLREVAEGILDSRLRDSTA